MIELLVRLDDTDHRSHRFLGETLERLHKRGHDEALEHYRKAHEHKPDFPAYLANMGRSYLARNEAALFLAHVDQLAKPLHDKLMDDTNTSIYADALKAVGQGELASVKRQKSIAAGSKNPFFYVDEARYQQSRGDTKAALPLLDRARDNGAADDYSTSIRASILAQSGSPLEASALRRQHIEANSKEPAFYVDEVRYLADQQQFTQALSLLDRARDNGAADDYSTSIRASILAQSGSPLEASALRRQQIEANSKTPAFYVDEARYLADQQQFTEALALLDRARDNGAANDNTKNIRQSILQRQGG